MLTGSYLKFVRKVCERYGRAEGFTGTDAAKWYDGLRRSKHWSHFKPLLIPAKARGRGGYRWRSCRQAREGTRDV